MRTILRNHVIPSNLGGLLYVLHELCFFPSCGFCCIKRWQTSVHPSKHHSINLFSKLGSFSWIKFDYQEWRHTSRNKERASFLKTLLRLWELSRKNGKNNIPQNFSEGFGSDGHNKTGKWDSAGLRLIAITYSRLVGHTSSTSRTLFFSELFVRCSWSVSVKT